MEAFDLADQKLREANDRLTAAQKQADSKLSSAEATVARYNHPP